MKFKNGYFYSLILSLFLLIVWEVIVDLWHINVQILPSPSNIFSAFLANYALLLPHIGQTMLETVIGLILATILGVGVAIMLRFSQLLKKAIYPLLIFSQTIPMIALAPLLLIWFGFGILPKVIVVTLYCFFPIAVAFADGMEKVSPQLIRLLQSMGASRLKILWLAEIPGALPSFFSGLRIAAAYSVTGAIVGEYVGGYQGLGIFMQNAAHSYAVALVFVVIIVTSLLSILLFGLVSVLEYFFIPWHRKAR
ncbi:MAG TPA: ABC transporter permease [Patescibacteria group bacterium]